MVVPVGQALQKHERDEEQRDDKMDAVHESKRERSITKPDFLSGFLLWKQAGKALRLKHDKGDANDECLQHAPSKQALPFATDVIAGGLQTHAAEYQQQRAGCKRRWKQKTIFLGNGIAGSDHQPRATNRYAQRGCRK